MKYAFRVSAGDERVAEDLAGNGIVDRRRAALDFGGDGATIRARRE